MTTTYLLHKSAPDVDSSPARQVVVFLYYFFLNGVRIEVLSPLGGITESVGNQRMDAGPPRKCVAWKL